MRIVFSTTLSPQGSTIIGRVLPIAKRLARTHKVSILLLNEKKSINISEIDFHVVGKEPFTRNNAGKKRLKGLRLIWNMLSTALHTTLALFRIKPDVVIAVKPLPSNIAGVSLWWLFNKKRKIILDVDDFELTANKLSSFSQRAAIHWATKTGAHISSQIVCATPFLQDHFNQTTKDKKPVFLIPTSLAIQSIKLDPSNTPTIVYLGSVSISSGHRVDMLPDILEQIRKHDPTLTMTVAGDGNDVKKIKEKFKDKGLEKYVSWFGRFSPENLSDILSQQSILIDPVDNSIAQRAKSSYRVTLATITGLPVITSDIGIRSILLPTQLHEKLFAESSNPKSYAEKIINLINTGWSDEEAKLIKKKADKYSWEKLVSEYNKIISL